MDAWTLGQVQKVWQARVAAEREACAQVAESERDTRLESAARADDDSWATIERLRAATAENVAAAIRARTTVVSERSEAP